MTLLQQSGAAVFLVLLTVCLQCAGVAALICYRGLCLPSWESAFYFSASSYATVGYGDLVLPLKWRLLGPLESMVGMLMSGISVGLLFAVITHLIEGESRSGLPLRSEAVAADHTSL